MDEKKTEVTNEHLDEDLEKELMKINHKPVKALLIILALIVSLVCYFILNLRFLGSLIIVTSSFIGYFSAKKEQAQTNELVEKYKLAKKNKKDDN